MPSRARFFVLFVLIALSVFSAPTTPPAQAALSDHNTPHAALLQFTSGRHTLGFQSTAVYIVGADRLLCLDFAGTSGVSPVVAAPPLRDRVQRRIYRRRCMGISHPATLLRWQRRFCRQAQ